MRQNSVMIRVFYIRSIDMLDTDNFKRGLPLLYKNIIQPMSYHWRPPRQPNLMRKCLAFSIDLTVSINPVLACVSYAARRICSTGLVV